MKKNKLLILVILILSVFYSNNIFSQNDISIFIDGEQKVFYPVPIIQDGTTLVPMRDSFETLGCRIYWDPITRSAVAARDSVNIKVTIGKNEAFVNGNKIYISVVPQIIGESTYVPLRFISESLGAEVDWNGSTRTITILDKTKKQNEVNTLYDTQKYELRTVFSFINMGDKINVQFDILSGAISTSPYQNDISFDIQPSPNKVYNDDYGNKYSIINLDNIKPNEQIDIVITKKLYNSAINYNINDKTIKSFDNLDNIGIYISSQLQTESDSPLIIEKAKQLSKNEVNPYIIAKNTYSFVNTYMTYDLSDEYARKGALNALITSRGLCEDYSKLFVALLRANEIPARSVFGYWITDDITENISYDRWYNIDDSAHEWPEFYLDDHGWIIAEPTYDFMINGKKTVPWKQFANQENNGHIIYGYEPNDENAIKWRIEGYGILNLEYQGSETHIRKIR